MHYPCLSLKCSQEQDKRNLWVAHAAPRAAAILQPMLRNGPPSNSPNLQSMGKNTTSYTRPYEKFGSSFIFVGLRHYEKKALSNLIKRTGDRCQMKLFRKRFPYLMQFCYKRLQDRSAIRREKVVWVAYFRKRSKSARELGQK